MHTRTTNKKPVSYAKMQRNGISPSIYGDASKYSGEQSSRTASSASQLRDEINAVNNMGKANKRRRKDTNITASFGQDMTCTTSNV